MSKFQIIFIGFFIAFLINSSAFSSFAQMGPEGEPFKNSGTFGEFEVGLPGIAKGTLIDDFVGDSKPILKFINLAVNAVIAVLVIIGLITIVIGGYTYMTAGGDGKKVGAAKEMITAALAGIVLSLISVIILNTINKYLGTDAQEPQLGTSSSGSTPGGSGDGSGGGSESGGSGGGGGLPESENNGNGGNTGGNGSGGGGGGGNNSIGGDIFNDTPPRSTPQTLTVIIDDYDYYIRGSDGIDKRSNLSEILSRAQLTQGNTSGIKVASYGTDLARASAEANLRDGLINIGIPRDAQFISTPPITRK